MKRLRTLALGLAVLMSASFIAACQPGEPDETQSATTTATTTTVAPDITEDPTEEETEEPTDQETEAPTEEETEEPTTDSPDDAEAVNLLVWTPAEDQAEDQGNWLKQVTETFAEENPQWDITFEFGVMPEGEAKATVLQDVEAAADVYMYANDNLPDLVAGNGIARLGGETEQYVKDNNSEALVNSVIYDDALYGVPFTTNTWFMYYNKSMVTDAEIGSLEALLEKGKVAFPLSNGWYIASFYFANGGTMFGPDGTDNDAGIDFGGEVGTAVTEYLVDLVAHENFINDVDGLGVAAMFDGTGAAMFSGSWDYGALYEELGDDLGAAQLPTINIGGEDKQMMAFAGSKAIGVNPNADNMQAAVALARYLGSEDAQSLHYELRNIVPSHMSLLETPAMMEDPIVVAQNNTFDNTSVIQPFVPNMGNYWTPAETFGGAIVNGEVTADNAGEMTEGFNTSINASGVS